MRQRKLQSSRHSQALAPQAAQRRHDTDEREDALRPKEILFDMGVALVIALGFALLVQLALLTAHIS